MSISLKNACFNIWKSNTDRQGIKPKFKPLFIRYIGVENSSEYNDILKTYYENFKENPDTTILFASEIPMQAEFQIINYIGNELQNMNVLDMKHQDIVLFDDQKLNNLFLQSLDIVIPLAIRKEKFFNESTRNNFILKLIVWSYLYLRPVKYENNKTPKCFYYGDISRHEIYFLMLTHLMGYDVIYVNPLREEHWEDIDELKLSELHKNNQILQIETFQSRIANGQKIENCESITLQLEREIESQLFTGTGVYKPWQFRNGTTTAMFLNSTIIDLNQNWLEQSRVRQGFKIEDKNVFVPVFFQQIDGVYKNINEYKAILSKCSDSPITLVSTNRGEELLNRNFDQNNKYKLTFCQLNDATLNKDAIKKVDFYPFKKYKMEIQDLILNKINETIKDARLFSKKLDKEETLNLIMILLNISEQVIRLIDNYDFTQDIPKITIFLNKEEGIEEDVMYVLAFLHKMAFDIVIFNPSGLFGATNVINPERINTIRLDEMQYDKTYTDLKSKKGFLNKIFK